MKHFTLSMCVCVCVNHLNELNSSEYAVNCLMQCFRCLNKFMCQSENRRSNQISLPKYNLPCRTIPTDLSIDQFCLEPRKSDSRAMYSFFFYRSSVLSSMCQLSVRNMRRNNSITEIPCEPHASKTFSSIATDRNFVKSVIFRPTRCA